MIASLSNDDGDVNENGKRAVGLHRGGSRGRVQGVRAGGGAGGAPPPPPPPPPLR